MRNQIATLYRLVQAITYLSKTADDGLSTTLSLLGKELQKTIEEIDDLST